MWQPVSMFRAGLVVTVAVVCGNASLSAQICNVPADRGSIQAAVDDSGCSTVAIAPGTYYETVEITRDVFLLGSGSTPGSSATTIAAQLIASGAGVNVQMWDLRVDTAGPASIGCFEQAVAISDGARTEVKNVRIRNGTGPGDCRFYDLIFADDFETAGTGEWTTEGSR